MTERQAGPMAEPTAQRTAGPASSGTAHLPAIDPREVSVVVQGPYHPEQTPACLASIARALPGAEVILSVWKAGPPVPVHELPAGTVLLNEDPGALDLHDVLSPEVERRTNIVVTNLNRQILSSRNGLALARRPYALKLRTDMTVEHTGFLDYAARFRGIPGPCRVFEERIVTTSARSPHRAFCFFVQDFCSFGLTADMRRLWDAPLLPPRDELLALPVAERDARVLVPEQHLLLSALRPGLAGSPAAAMRSALDRTPELVELTEKAIAGNLVCLDVRRFGVRTLKPSLAWVNEPGDFRYTWLWVLKASFAEYLSWCERHCDHDFTPMIDAMRAEYEAEMADLPLKNLLVTDANTLNPEALLWLGEKAHREGRLEQAGNAYATLLRAGYDHHRLSYGIGVLQIQSGNPQSGVASLEAAARKAPDFLPCYESLVNYYRQIGDEAGIARWQEELRRRQAG